jgi:hypothetical protein
MMYRTRSSALHVVQGFLKRTRAQVQVLGQKRLRISKSRKPPHRRKALACDRSKDERVVLRSSGAIISENVNEAMPSRSGLLPEPLISESSGLFKNRRRIGTRW